MQTMTDRRTFVRALGAGVLVSLVPSAALAHHKPWHENGGGSGKPDSEPTEEPTSEPTEGPTVAPTEEPDTAAPFITSRPVVVGLTASGATVQWATDEASDSEVEWEAV